MRGKDLRYFSKNAKNLSKRRADVIITGLIHDEESGNWRYRDPIKKLQFCQILEFFSLYKLDYANILFFILE